MDEFDFFTEYEDTTPDYDVWEENQIFLDEPYEFETDPAFYDNLLNDDDGAYEE